MKKIYFNNSCNWSSVQINNCNDNGIYFLNENGKKTGIVYSGDLSIGVDYKWNENLKKDK